MTESPSGGRQRTEDLDLLIAGGTLLTMDDAMSVIHDPVIGIRGGKIAFAEKGPGPAAGCIALETLDADGCLILPGLVNTHTHAPMVCFRGMADDLPLMDWLQHHIFPAEAKIMNADTVFHGATLAVAEMLLSGTTTFADGYFFESRVAQAASCAGIRAVAAEGFIDFAPPDAGTVRRHVRKAESFIREWIGSELITPAVFCHSPYACAPRTLRSLKDCADAAGVPFFIHLSETREEVRNILEGEGLSPVRYLDRLGVLNESTVAVHCVWLDDGEIEILADRGVRVSHLPESNMKLACGIAPVPRMLARNVKVGLGTDGCASNNDLDMLREMDTAAKLHKLALLDPTVLPDTAVLRMATRGGAEALGLDGVIGSIEKGKKADLILIDTRRPHLTPLYNPYSHIVYAASGDDVITSVIGGRIVVRDRKLLTMDPGPSIARVRETAAALRPL